MVPKPGWQYIDCGVRVRRLFQSLLILCLAYHKCLRYLQILEMTTKKRHVGSAILSDAAVKGGADTFQAVTRILDRHLTKDQVQIARTNH